MLATVRSFLLTFTTLFQTGYTLIFKFDCLVIIIINDNKSKIDCFKGGQPTTFQSQEVQEQHIWYVKVAKTNIQKICSEIRVLDTLYSLPGMF